MGGGGNGGGGMGGGGEWGGMGGGGEWGGGGMREGGFPNLRTCQVGGNNITDAFFPNEAFCWRMENKLNNLYSYEIIKLCSSLLRQVKPKMIFGN
jgi:hypothetical protein